VTVPSTTLTAIGFGFVSGSVILLNGVATPATFVDSSRLTANLTLGSPAPASLTIQVANPIPTYEDDTISDLSRALTGWNYAPASNPIFTNFGIDYSHNLIADESQHDRGSKTILGNVTIPGGQTAAQDRDQVLDAIFRHPSR
jgi:uncharacterized protein (DUF1800 family)